ncbi:hypothetical protein JIN84_02465 [Luteolibacter yonseiensis]|uniref:Uncharacterized protein n=1 Tax=Luteolibacter yonseiensis TaxID=1144680 RepID=A0A934R3B2_9BACT|nr:hypothetical protein [Luteolibacter yonseiensis]MBK1814459.1 hypothetical protein [Luteolibacter yonseiensis]
MIILIISIISAFGFSAAAKKKGYNSSRFWIYPLAIGFGTFIASLLLNTILPKIIGNGESAFSKIYPYAVGICSLMLVLSLISKAWKQIESLPDRKRVERAGTSDIERPGV